MPYFYTTTKKKKKIHKTSNITYFLSRYVSNCINLRLILKLADYLTQPLTKTFALFLCSPGSVITDMNLDFMIDNVPEDNNITQVIINANTTFNITNVVGKSII